MNVRFRFRSHLGELNSMKVFELIWSSVKESSLS